MTSGESFENFRETIKTTLQTSGEDTSKQVHSQTSGEDAPKLHSETSGEDRQPTNVEKPPTVSSSNETPFSRKNHTKFDDISLNNLASTTQNDCILMFDRLVKISLEVAENDTSETRTRRYLKIHSFRV